MTKPAQSRAVRDLVIAAAQSGLRGITESLSLAVDAPCAVFDTAGNVLAVFPERSLVDFAAVIDALSSRHDTALWARQVEVADESLAIIALGNVPETDLGEVALATTALELGRLRARVEGRRELAGQVLDDVLSHRASEVEAQNRFKALGLDIAEPMRVLVHQLTDSRKNNTVDEVNLQAAISGSDEHVVRVKRGDQLVVLLADSPIVNLVARNLLVVNVSGNPVSSVGVSRPHTGASGLRAAFFEATSAAQLGPGLHEPDRISLSRLMVMMNPQVDLAAIASDYLAPILREGDQTGRDGHLLETLAAYLETGRSVSAAAERLFIHRNTLRYRLVQLEERLGVDLDSTEDAVDLWLALMVRKSLSTDLESEA